MGDWEPELQSASLHAKLEIAMLISRSRRPCMAFRAFRCFPHPAPRTAATSRSAVPRLLSSGTRSHASFVRPLERVWEMEQRRITDLRCRCRYLGGAPAWLCLRLSAMLLSAAPLNSGVAAALITGPLSWQRASGRPVRVSADFCQCYRPERPSLSTGPGIR